MIQNDSEMIGACGIDCGECPIRLAENDPEIAEKLAKSFRDQGLIPDATPDIFHCDGCHGDVGNHWSPDCGILACCVDQMGFEYCSECDLFPCELLTTRAANNEKYQEALDRLRGMKS